MVRACVVMMAVLGTGVGAQDGALPLEREVVPASENAALHYWRAWWVIGAKELEEASLDVAGIFSPDPDAVAHHDAPVLSEATRTFMTLVENVARIEYCDFGAAAPSGVDAILFVNGHLEPVERSGAALLHDAKLLLAEGDNATAANRILACLRLTEHVARDRNESSHAVAIRMIGRAAKLIEERGERFQEQDRKIISLAFERFDLNDPLYFADGVRAVARQTEQFFLKETEGGMFDPAAELEDPPHPAVVQALRDQGSPRLARAAIRREIVRSRQMSEAYAAAIQSPDPEQQIGTLRDQVHRAEFGPFAPTMFSLLEEQRARDTRARESLNMLHAWTSGETETPDLPAD